MGQSLDQSRVPHDCQSELSIIAQYVFRLFAIGLVCSSTGAKHQHTDGFRQPCPCCASPCRIALPPTGAALPNATGGPERDQGNCGKYRKGRSVKVQHGGPS